MQNAYTTKKSQDKYPANAINSYYQKTRKNAIPLCKNFVSLFVLRWIACFLEYKTLIMSHRNEHLDSFNYKSVVFAVGWMEDGTQQRQWNTRRRRNS